VRKNFEDKYFIGGMRIELFYFI